MSAVRLDLSPMFVNRTAAFNLCVDLGKIAAAEAGLDHDFQFFGHAHRQVPDQQTARRYVAKFFDALGAGTLGQQEPSLWGAGNAAGRGAGSRPTFYIDPLYVLFAPLQPSDVVVLLDLSPITHPQWHNPAVSAAYTAAMRKILAVRPRLAAISRNTIDTLEANFGGYGSPVRHLPLYAPDFIRQGAERGVKPLPVPWPYFLFVGSLETRKNMIAAIKAFQRSALARDGYKLVIVGGRGHGADEITAQALSTEGVIISGYLSQDDVCAAYQGAAGFVYPSYLEGFGVPLLEAMSFGVPCIASFTGACPEVGGSDVVYVDPDDHAGMAREMRDIAGMPTEKRKKLGARLMLRAQHVFSYEAFSNNVKSLLVP